MDSGGRGTNGAGPEGSPDRRTEGRLLPDREDDGTREREGDPDAADAAREHFERAYLQQQLILCGGKVGQLAKRVGMERTHLYRKLKALGVDYRSRDRG